MLFQQRLYAASVDLQRTFPFVDYQHFFMLFTKLAINIARFSLLVTLLLCHFCFTLTYFTQTLAISTFLQHLFTHFHSCANFVGFLGYSAWHFSDRICLRYKFVYFFPLYDLIVIAKCMRKWINILFFYALQPCEDQSQRVAVTGSSCNKKLMLLASFWLCWVCMLVC